MSLNSPIICSRFDPTNSYLATGLIALDTHQIKVQSLNPAATLNTSFNLDKSQKLTKLTWINSDTVQLLAVCLTKGTILVYSPQTNSIIAELTTSNNVSISDFHYSKHSNTGWSSDIEGNVYEWNMNSYELIQQFKLGDFIDGVDSINRISTIIYQGKVQLLLASHAIYLFDFANKTLQKTFPGHIQPVNSLVVVPDSELFLTSAQNDRFINLYSTEKITTKAVFVSPSASVLDISIGISNGKSVLVAINENGNLEIFQDPLSETPTTPKKKKRKQQAGVTSRSTNSTIKISRPEVEIKSPQDSNLIINSISINDNSILYTWLENSTVPFVDSIPWIDETGEFSIQPTTTIVKPRPDLKSTQHTMYGHDIASAKLYSEGHAIVSDGTNIRDLEEEEEPEQESLAEKLDRLSVEKPKPTKKKLDTTTGTSLAIILAQSLKNNDHSLLETVLSNHDPTIIQNTITRLNPYLAVDLLDRLSERIQRQSSRFDQLNYWLKWILVIHGAVIASLPNLNGKLSSLHSVLIKKADTMSRLLELQGRLNMLYEQNELKRELLDEEAVDVEQAGESDVEYIEELDDAQVNGEIDEEMEFEGEDDYIESDEEQEEESDDEDIPLAATLENYSDLEIDE
ncbi:U3 small nucleolar RNA-associated protein 5 [Spathaspora sp. JA1]|nr:U3 small nucleolar RNA-associated protein 5 [Spathaspora sp. JA1]